MEKKQIKDYVNGKLNYLQSEPNFVEPILVKAGSNLLKLGINEVPPKVDCRVIAEENYQKLIGKLQSDAVGFLEWSAKNDWNHSCLDDLWYNVNSDKYPEGITASELYNKFKEEQK